MFNRMKNSLIGKVMLGYVAIITLLLATTLLSILIGWKNKSMDKLVAEAYYPMVLALKQTEVMASESFVLTNDWVYHPSMAGKEELETIHETEVGKQVDDLLNISGQMEDASVVKDVRDVVSAVDALAGEEQVVINKLNSEASYRDSLAVAEAISAM